MKTPMVRRLDTDYGWMALLWLWAATICAAAFAISVSRPEMGFMSATVALIGFTCLITSLHYYAKTFRDSDENAQECEDTTQPVAQSAQVEIEPHIEERKRFYDFVKAVMVDGVLGEDRWFKRGLKRTEYRAWVTLLEELNIISAPDTTGRAPRRRLVDFQTALNIIAEDAKRQNGVKDYWQPVAPMSGAGEPPLSTTVNSYYKSNSQVQIELN